MTNQSNTCKFVVVNLDNYLLEQESEWRHLALHNTFYAFTPTCFAAGAYGHELYLNSSFLRRNQHPEFPVMYPE